MAVYLEPSSRSSAASTCVSSRGALIIPRTEGSLKRRISLRVRLRVFCSLSLKRICIHADIYGLGYLGFEFHLCSIQFFWRSDPAVACTLRDTALLFVSPPSSPFQSATLKKLGLSNDEREKLEQVKTILVSFR